MVQQVLQRFGFTYSSPQATPLPTRHSLSALPSDESVESSGPYPELVGCLMYLMTCTRPDLAYPLSILARYVAPGRHRPEHMAAAKRVVRYLCSTSGLGLVLGGRSPVVLTGHADASWADDQATQRSSQGYTFSLGSGSVSWRATRSSSVLGSSCEAEIYAGAMAAQELRWLTYLLADLREPPRSPSVLYVDNKAMVALCREQRLEHRTKHIALRYFLARELQQRGQLRLAYVASEANTADVFTKALAPCDHQRFCTQLATGGVGTRVGPARAEGAAGSGVAPCCTGALPIGSGGPSQPRPYFFPLLEQVLGLPPSPGPAPPLECPQPVQLQSQLQPVSLLPAPSPYAGPTGGLAERREPASRPASPVRTTRTSRRAPRPRPPLVPGTHQMTLRPSTAPLRALVAELVDFAARCRLDYAASLVAESVSVYPPSVGGECALSTDVLEDRQEEFQCFAAALPHLVSTLLAPEGDPHAPDIPTPQSYAEAIEGPYSSQWQSAMDAEMASWKSTGTYVDEVPPPGANIVSGMWIFRVKRPPGSPPVFKARYVARGFSQRQGVDYFKTFSPTPKMTTLRVLLHVAAQRDYELHSLDFSTAFLQGSLHEEIWLRRPPGFTGSFPPGTQWSLRRPVYGLRQAPREWHDTLRTTLAALGFAPSTADPSLLLRTDTSLPPFYILVYVDDLVFATADTAGLTHVLQRFDFMYSSPQATPLSTRHSLSALPSDESVEPSGPYPELVGCLMYLMTCTRPDLAYPLSILACYVAPGRHRPEHMATAKRVLRYLCSTSGLGLVLGGRRPVVLTGHADASWADDQATHRSSQGYTFSLGSGSVSWRSTRSSSVLGSSCEAEIYAGAMAAQELRWLTYLFADLGEPPRSPPVLYVDNKAMLALCWEHRLEHRTKHIALRYFLARELQQRGQLRLAYVAFEANTGDIFTKALAPGDHQRFCTMLAEPRFRAEPHRPTEPRSPTAPHCPACAAPAATAASAASAATAAPAATAAMASPTALTFDAEGRVVDFDVWVDDLQLFLQCDSRDGVSLFDHTCGVSTAPAATADKAITGPYSSQWQTAMDAEMASWKSTGTYVDAVPPSGANIVDGMWIFRVKRPPGSPPAFKARYVARGFNQRQGVDYFQTFSPTPKMTTLRVLHLLDFNTAFLQGSLHEETTLAALGFNPSTADPSLFLRTDTSLLPFYVLVYVNDLVFATADTEVLTLVKLEMQKRHSCTDLGELRSHLGLQITRDRARRTITLTQSHMVHQVLQRFGLQFSSPQPTPLSTGHSLSAPPSDESVEPSGPYPELVGCLIYLMTCTLPELAYPLSLLARYVAPGRHRKVHWDAAKKVLHYLCSTLGMGIVLGGRGPVVLTSHADASWVDDLATQRSSQGYTCSLGSGSVSWRSTRSPSVLCSSCEAEIYAGAMAAQELRWLTYLLTDLGEQPRSPPVLSVDNKDMIALCQEHRLEHRTKHIALRYFLARELQQRGQLRLAYVASRANTADIFTKALQPSDHQRFSTVLGLVPTLPHLLTA
ncbi:unnamed protein product [Closterium sp. NIES-54]